MNENTSTSETAGNAGNAETVGLEVDEDLESMMAGVLAQFSGPTVDPDAGAVWQALTEVGISRLTAPEETGGSGAGWAEAATLLRLAAAAGVAVPFAETDLVVGPLRRAAGLDDSSPGTATLAVLGANGRARRVAWAGETDTVLFVRRSAATGDDAPRYEIVDIATDRAEITPADGTSAVPRGDVTPPPDADWTTVDATAVEAAVMRGALARAVQCVGAAEGMLDAAIAHTTERNQFGRALAKFQSVQNLVVDIAAETVLARAAVDQAVADALATDLGGPLSGFRVAVARSVASQAVAVAVRNTHQVHGAIGTTHEHTLHRLTLPALQWRGEFGSAEFWETRLTDAAVAGGMDGAWPMVVDGVSVDGAAAAWLDRVTGA
ncbi:acyl-CoA dehydrogenase family protein [Dietzia psychralcaliphila]|uniref:acyl-CoA dehydrogenase family protein n=1 Tax=Dietzia psychralcaliphila TaxID=139021 RepID=UPI001C1E877B|nr:acyl-CoA dehydrogenase family protein [Dietzia psychralcaliphila]